MSAKLAVLGGDRIVPEGAVKPWPHVTDEDRAAVAAVLAGDDLGEQRRINEEGISKEFGEYIGAEHVVPVSSGTAALHLAVAGCEIGPGDEVICPAFTYWATAAAVLHHNGIPVFVDVEPETWTMDPALLEGAITPQTKAIMPVHIHGMPAAMDAIMEIAAKHDLRVIEDCAQAHGATFKGKKCGSIGDAAGFSLQSSKLLTTGSYGGLFATNNDEIAHVAKTLQYLGEIVIPGRERTDQRYNATGLGWMYRGDVMGQAFTRSQLKRLDHYNALRGKNCELLTSLIKDVPGILTPHVPDDRGMRWYTYAVRLAPEQLGLDVPAPEVRERVEKALGAEGVPVGRWQRMPVPMQDIFQSRAGYGKGCPWDCGHYHGDVTYEIGDYPVSQAFVDSNMYVSGIWPPNEEGLIRQFAEAIEKVMSQPEELMKVEL
ncbi:MAG TPA: DegT/DnrJ/EryC1/StrS family aminotransferase [Armatimonadota bacterium]|nr:DegT/DnrJ/EryC1/StrS family aminotransferase [Armatimonadota bacterium]